jgi:hypothetical protein
VRVRATRSRGSACAGWRLASLLCVPGPNDNAPAGAQGGGTTGTAGGRSARQASPIPIPICAGRPLVVFTPAVAMGGIVSSIRVKPIPVSDVAMEAGTPITKSKQRQGSNPNSAVMMLTETQLDEFREAFNSFDEDGGGSIDATELEDVLKSLGQDASKEELDKLIQVADTDGSGDIDFLEFVVLVAHKMKKDNDTSKHSDDIKRAFRSKHLACRNEHA